MLLPCQPSSSVSMASASNAKDARSGSSPEVRAQSTASLTNAEAEVESLIVKYCVASVKLEGAREIAIREVKKFPG